MPFGFRLKYAILLLIFFFACQADKEKTKDEKFVRTYGEILFLSEKFSGDTIKLKEKIDSVLSVNQATMKQIDSLANLYSKDPQKWAKFFDDVKKYLEGRRLNVQVEKHR